MILPEDLFRAGALVEGGGAGREVGGEGLVDFRDACLVVLVENRPRELSEAREGRRERVMPRTVERGKLLEAIVALSNLIHIPGTFA